MYRQVFAETQSPHLLSTGGSLAPLFVLSPGYLDYVPAENLV